MESLGLCDEGFQCTLFADLFERAVVKGLAAMAQQNPGLYRENAAEYCRVANQLIVQLKAILDPNLRFTHHVDPLAMPGNQFGLAILKYSLKQYFLLKIAIFKFFLDPNAGYTIYFGQRPWRIQQESGGLADPVTEHAAKVALEVELF